MNATLEIKNISLTIPSVEKPILSNINYQVNKGDFIIILGSNGSGKSSLLKILDKRYSSTSGNVLLNGKILNHISHKKFSKKIITLTQNTHESLFSSLTVYENFLLVAECRKPLFANRVKKDKRNFCNYINKFNPNLPNKLDQLVDSLSGGEKQALALALCVLYPPDILLLDEHTSALDPKSAQNLMHLTQEVVAQHGMTCLLTTHDLDIALQYGNRILALRNGEVYQAININKKMVLTQQELLASCY